MSRDKTPVIAEMQEKTEILTPLAEDFIKDPYVLPTEEELRIEIEREQRAIYEVTGQ